VTVLHWKLLVLMIPPFVYGSLQILTVNHACSGSVAIIGPEAVDAQRSS
jgi:hypothetical protein